jgi:2-polyprenyl-6-methoxyphenol hydroxylase-like FAD-dependent oxidoreductase
MEPWLMDKQVDVVVVGAGPVGLLLAIELTLGGADVLVLERLTAPNLGIKAPSVGSLDFAQRYTGTFSADGTTIAGAWEICHDGTTWEHDFNLTYIKA